MEPVSIVLVVTGWLISSIISRIVIALETWATSDNVDDLGNKVRSLKIKLTAFYAVLSNANSSHLQNNKPLLELVRLFEQTVYDAEDLVDELDYYRLQDNMKNKRDNHEQASVPAFKTKFGVKIVSMFGKLSCRHDQSVLVTKPKPSKPGPSKPEPTLVRADMLKNIETLVNALDEICNPTNHALALEHLAHIAKIENRNLQETEGSASSFNRTDIFGRNEEITRIVEVLTRDNSGRNSPLILPIVGLGGIGKTTLAESVFNYPNVKSYFKKRIWLWVSYSTWNVTELTLQMLDHLGGSEHRGVSSLPLLQSMLRKSLGCEKTLLVLDNLCQDRNYPQWNLLLSPFGGSNAEHRKILVTTRYPFVAKSVGTVEKYVELGNLEGDELHNLFNECAFGVNNPEVYPSLITVGKYIVSKLSGYPFEVKTVCKILRDKPDHGHWNKVLQSDEWRTPRDKDGPNNHIMSNLELSYKYLPSELKNCFSYCSLFPQNFKFKGDDLINLWMAQSFICPKIGQSSRVLGMNYLMELVGRGFFQEIIKEDTKHQQGTSTYYLMHKLMYDLAKMVSSKEFLTIDGSDVINIGSSIRHLSIITTSSYDRNNNTVKENFVSNLKKIVKELNVPKLRTLILIGNYDSNFAETFRTLFEKTKCIRVLRLSMESYNIDYLLINFSNSLLLRYLKLESASQEQENMNSNNNKLPLFRFYHLESLDISDWHCGFNFQGLTHELVSIRSFHAKGTQFAKIFEVGKLAPVEELREFEVQKKHGFQIKELGELTKLRGSLRISGLENIDSKAEAVKAELAHKGQLEELSLYWKDRSDGLPDIDGLPPNVDADILDGLEPPRNIKCIEICEFAGTTFPSWMVRNGSLSCLQSLSLINCANLEVLPSLGHLPVLEKLHVEGMHKVKMVTAHFYGRNVQTTFNSLREMVFSNMASCESWLGINSGPMFRSLRKLEIIDCPLLSDLPPVNQDQQYFPQLTELVVQRCEKLALPNLPHANTLAVSFVYGVFNPLRSLSLILRSPGELSMSVKWSDKVLDVSNFKALTELTIRGCPNASLSWNESLPSLKRLIIKDQVTMASDLPMSLELLEVSSDHVTAMHLSKWLLRLRSLLALVVTLSNVKCLVVGNNSSTSNEGSVSHVGYLQIISENLPHLQEMRISECTNIDTLELTGKGFQEFTSLQKLTIERCPGVFSSLPLQENGSCFFPPSLRQLEIHYMHELESRILSNLTSLKSFKLVCSSGIKSLDIHPLSSLEELVIKNCSAITSLKGVCSHKSLKNLSILDCPVLTANWDAALGLETKFSLPVQVLVIDDISFLKEKDCKRLTSLTTLVLDGVEVANLTADQEKSLGMLVSLQQIEFRNWPNLQSLPSGLRQLTSLTTLKIAMCEGITSLQEEDRSSQQELHLYRCSKRLEQHCRSSNVKRLYISP